MKFGWLAHGLLELAEEARNVSVESGQSYYTEEVQSQDAGLTRPVFVTIMEYSLFVPKEGTMIADHGEFFSVWWANS